MHASDDSSSELSLAPILSVPDHRVEDSAHVDRRGD